MHANDQNWMKRAVMCLKDIEILYGKKEKAARRIMREILAILGKGHKDPLTVTEFCKVTKIAERDVYSRMK